VKSYDDLYKKAESLKSARNHFNIISVLLLFTAFVYTVIRASRISIFNDEAVTYFISCQSLSDIVNYSLVTANNHLLKTLLIKFFVKFLGMHEFVIRIPALLGHLIYLIGVSKILKVVFDNKLSVAGVIFLVFNPFLLELFSAGRGYALAMGFFSFSLYYTLLYVDEKHKECRWKYANVSLWFSVVAVLASLTFVYIYSALAILFFVNEFVSLKKKKVKDVEHFSLTSFGIFASASSLLIIYTMPLAKLIEENQFFYGGNTSFWHDTVGSLILSTLYGQSYISPILILIIKICIVAFLSCTGSILFYKMFLKKDFNQKDRYLAAIFSLLIMCCLIIILHRIVLGSKYIIQRTACFFIPLFFITILILVAYCRDKKSKIKRLFSGFIIIISIILSCHFLVSANFRSYFICPYAADIKKVMKDFKETLDEEKFSPNSIYLGTNWPFAHSMNFYKEKYRIEWLHSVEFQGADGIFDYYLLTLDKNKTLLGQEVVSKNIEIMKKYNLEVIKEFASTGLFLAAPKKKDL